MKFPKNQNQYSLFSKCLQVWLLIVTMIIVGIACTVKAYSDVRLMIEGNCYGEIELVEDSCYITNLPFKVYSPECHDFVEFVLAAGLIDRPSDVKFTDDSLNFEISPKFNIGECSFSKGSYHDVIDRQELEAAKERCHGYCEAVVKAVELTISELGIGYQYKLGIIAAVEAGARKAHKCCASDESFMYDCFRFVIDAYERSARRQLADWEKFKRDAASYIDYRNYPHG